LLDIEEGEIEFGLDFHAVVANIAQTGLSRSGSGEWVDVRVSERLEDRLERHPEPRERRRNV